jgi:hypothetical protein
MGGVADRGQDLWSQPEEGDHMPNGIYPVPKFRYQDKQRTSAREGLRPSVALRLRVAWHRERLDQHLARGVDPAASKELELRAAQLLHSRGQLANRVDSALEHARTQGAPFTAEVPVRRADVRDCAEDLLALARRLRDEAPIDVQGAAMTSRLLTDGCSPLYRDSDQSLRYTVRVARLALDPVGAAKEDLAAAA